MRARTVLVAALLAGISIACSKPASNSSRQPDTGAPPGGREIKLVDAPSPDSQAVVSALEAGLGSRLTLEGSPSVNHREGGLARKAATPRPRAEEALPSVALTEAAPALAVAASTTSLPVVPLGSAPPAVVAVHSEVRETYGGYTAPSTRGSVILIRGGMGAADDDCKVHPVQARGHGIAINNVAQMPGRVAVNDRLPRSGPGFTRIR